MTNKKARGLYRELCRRIWLDQKGNLDGFGKSCRFYNRNWRPSEETLREQGGYKGIWESDVMVKLRKSVGM